MGHAVALEEEREAEVAGGREGVALVEDYGCGAGEAGGEPVPHHPGAGGDVEEAVRGADVAVQDVFLLVLEEGAAGAVHDAFGGAGCAGAVEDVGWVIRGEGAEFGEKWGGRAEGVSVVRSGEGKGRTYVKRNSL